MQKKLIALAVAGLVSGGAFAQSNVSIYGIVDVGYMNENFDGADKATSSIDSGLLSTSRIGFKGEEALGNGLKAVFNLEYGLTNDTNAQIGNARQQSVGLSHATYGTVLAGFLQGAGYDFAVAASPLAAAQFGAGRVLEFNGNSVINAGATGRIENAVAYVSPTFAGFNVALNHGRLTETANTTGQSDAYANAIGLNYANGPISAGLVYAKASLNEKGGDLAGAVNDVEEYGIRGGYDFGVAKLQAAYQTYELKKGLGATGDADGKFVLGVTVPVSAAGNVVAEFASLNVKDKNVGATYNDAKSYTLAYTHALSKRTTAYAGYNQVNSDVAKDVDLGDVKRFAFGVRHAF